MRSCYVRRASTTSILSTMARTPKPASSSSTTSASQSHSNTPLPTSPPTSPPPSPSMARARPRPVRPQPPPRSDSHPPPYVSPGQAIADAWRRESAENQERWREADRRQRDYWPRTAERRDKAKM